MSNMQKDNKQPLNNEVADVSLAKEFESQPISAKRSFLYYATHSIVATVGFLLSPLSWWNDLFINVPLSYGFAWCVGRFLLLFMTVNKSLYVFLFVVGYWLTNLAGLFMLERGLVKIVSKQDRKINWKRNLLIALVYSVIITIIIYTDYHGILSYLHIIPSWVKV